LIFPPIRITALHVAAFERVEETPDTRQSPSRRSLSPPLPSELYPDCDAFEMFLLFPPRTFHLSVFDPISIRSCVFCDFLALPPTANVSFAIFSCDSPHFLQFNSDGFFGQTRKLLSVSSFLSRFCWDGRVVPLQGFSSLNPPLSSRQSREIQILIAFSTISISPFAFGVLLFFFPPAESPLRDPSPEPSNGRRFAAANIPCCLIKGVSNPNLSSS